MDNQLDKRKIEEALQLLSALLERRNQGPFGLIICGGSALLVNGLRTETTKDVDVLGLTNEQRNIEEARALPEELVSAVRTVAETLNLDENWLNAGPSSIINPNLPNLGLPEGFRDRLIKKSYGTLLQVYFIGRRDQIFFKLFAAVDRGGPSYHLEDLLGLEPSDEEWLAAARWSMTQDPSVGYAKSLKQILKAINHAEIAEKL